MEKQPLSDYARKMLRRIRNVSEDSYLGNFAKLRTSISEILGDDKIQLPMTPGEAWVSAVEADLAAMCDDARANWTKLFHQCVYANSANPDAAWKKKATAILTKIGPDGFHERFFAWMPALNMPRDQLPNRHGWPPSLSIEEANQDILRGLAWCVALQPTESSPRLLATLAISAYRKIPQIGSRAVRVGNACVASLSAIGTEECVAKLALLKIKVKNGTALRFIDGQLQKTADRLKVSRIDLEEMSIPAYGMEEIGKRTEQFGDFVAQITVDGDSVDLMWLKSDGSPQKAMPSAIKNSHAEEIKELKADVKDLENMLRAQRQRIEGLYLLNRSWPYATWSERYLDHPLVGSLARRLIWSFESNGSKQLGIFLDGQNLWHRQQTIARYRIQHGAFVASIE